MRVLRRLTPLLILICSTSLATETRRWVADTPDQLLKGRGQGVAVTEDGTLVAVPGWAGGPSVDEPVVAAGARRKDGSLIVGTGHPARLYEVKGDRVTPLADVPGEQVTAVLVTPSDEVYVASISPGVLFRLTKGGLEEVARLGEGGIWDLAWFGGSVVAAAGTPASLYRLGAQGMERWVELPDAHARSLASAGNSLIVGTSGKGLILAVDTTGGMSLLADSPFTEIPDLMVAPDGSVWAVALVGEPIQPPAIPKKANGDDESKSESSESTASVMELDLPKINGNTATSELLRLTPEGALLSVHRFAKQVASSVAWDGTGVLVGTGYQGEVWRFVSEGGARLTTVDAVQVVGILDGGAALLTQGPGQVLWRRQGSKSRYRIDGQWLPIPARFGEYAVTPASDGVRIRFRSGASEKPDESWLPWTDWLPAGSGKVPLPSGRSLQWEVKLDEGATVERVVVALREVNLAPEITALSVEEPGAVYLAAPPPSSGPVIDREHPDVNGIFTVIEPNGTSAKNSAKGKKYYRAGFRTVTWKVKDLNDDALQVRLDLEGENGFTMLVRDELAADQLGVDTTAIPDGTYRFRLTVSDQQTNSGNGLDAQRNSRWFVVDNTPPELTLTRGKNDWQLSVEDASSALSRVEWSRDGKEWHLLEPADGILDGRLENFTFPAGDGRHLVVVRAVDLHHNRTTTGAVEE